jgi:quinolinate synthase
MQAVAADLEHHGQRLMAEPLAALSGLALLVPVAGLSRLALSASRGLGGLWLMFRHVRMILCSERVLDYEAKTYGQEEQPVTSTAAADGNVGAARPGQAGSAGWAGHADRAGWAKQIRRLAAQRDAVILAHNYQAPEIQDVADHVGDSLALSRLAAASTASTIVFAGVYFMAETAKILAPERTVLIPDARAGCSLADSITAQQLREWKAEHPGAAVVAYVNTSAEVKAESDVCCTSANAVQIVASVPADQEILFLPDQFLGAHVQRATGRANMHIWLGECHVHAGISPDDLRRKAAAEAEAELFIHPECGCSTAALWQAGTGDLPAGRTRVLSTGGMLDAARTTTASAVLVATETGMLHQLRQANPAVRWEPVNPNAVCRFMKMTTPATLLRCLSEGVAEVHVAPGIAARARRAVQSMIAVGTPSAAGE